MSLSVKRCGRYGTTNTTPKRPRLTPRKSSGSATANDTTLVSCDRSLEKCDEETKTPATKEHLLVSPVSSDLTSVESTMPQNARSDTSVKLVIDKSLEELQHRRNELKHSIASKEQTLRNLNLVKLHRTKVCCQKCLTAV